jgi:single-strand DNA-binding protein
MNKVILIGRLTKDPEIRYSQAQEPLAIARFTVAVNRRFKRDGEPDADFIPCVSFGKSAEFMEKYFKKGMQIGITGRIQVRSYDAQDGTKRWSTEVVVEEQEFTESRAAFEARSQGGASSYSQPQSRPAQAPQPAIHDDGGFSSILQDINEDDLPF